MNLIANTVFITGASSGSGAACAEAFALHGANLVLAARRILRSRTISEALMRELNV